MTKNKILGYLEMVGVKAVIRNQSGHRFKVRLLNHKGKIIASSSVFCFYPYKDSKTFDTDSKGRKLVALKEAFSSLVLVNPFLESYLILNSDYNKQEIENEN